MTVRLLRATLVAGHPFGWWAAARFDILVSDAPADARVIVRCDGHPDAAATAVRPLPGRGHLWTWGTPPDRPPGWHPRFRFAVGLVSDSGEHWDTNNGWSYLMDDSHPLALGADGLAVRWATDEPIDRGPGERGPLPRLVRGAIGVREGLGRWKAVEVVATTDRWATTERWPAEYRGVNGHGVEEWAFVGEVGPDAGPVELAACCTADGVEWWDNNFGENYRA